MVEVAVRIPTSPPADRRARRREAILAAAKRLFLDKGFDAVSMGEIVRASGGSLSTLYELFDNKEGVLAAIVIEDRRESLEMMQRLIDRHAPPRETLTMLVNDMEAQFFKPDMIGMIRLIMTESLGNQDLGILLHEASLTPFDNLLIALFRQWTDEGKARIDHPEVAVDLLMGMLIHPRMKRACCGALEQDQAGQAVMAEAAITMFTSHYGIA